MKTIETVYNKLNTDKTELGTHKIELNKINDIKKLFSKIDKNSEKSNNIKKDIEDKFQNAQKELQRLSNLNENLISTLRSDILEVDRILKDLDMKLPSEVKDIFNKSYEKEIQLTRIANIYS